ncbi:ESF2/ABP1 family protein, partial [Tremellales sp. Uapishka_1]
MSETHSKRSRAEDGVINGDIASEAENAVASTSALPRAASTKKPSTSRSKKRKVLTPGIVYISRLPPGMTPQKVKHLMGRWGDTGKVYAQKRDAPTQSNPAQQNKRQKHAQANYSEAWVEFLDKNVAKTVAGMLNAEMIGGKKGDRFVLDPPDHSGAALMIVFRWRDDIWTMKYLSGFKWEMLGEQVAYERQAHTSRLRAEITRSRTEQGEYLKNVELARVLEKRRVKKAVQEEGTGKPPAEKTESRRESGGNGYRQRMVVEEKKGGMGGVFDSVFG